MLVLFIYYYVATYIVSELVTVWLIVHVVLLFEGVGEGIPRKWMSMAIGGGK
jgi:hypothetical protein